MCNMYLHSARSYDEVIICIAVAQIPLFDKSKVGLIFKIIIKCKFNEKSYFS